MSGRECGHVYGPSPRDPLAWTTCRRRAGHPLFGEDGIGHSPDPEWLAARRVAEAAWDGSPRPAERTVTVRGLELQVPDDDLGTRRYAGQIAFVPEDDLEALAEQGQWDSQFGSTFLLHDPVAEAALEAHGLLVRETRGGVHGTDRLRELLSRREES